MGSSVRIGKFRGALGMAEGPKRGWPACVRKVRRGLGQDSRVAEKENSLGAEGTEKRHAEL